MKNIVLIGFMGTGKTSIGRILAGRLGCPFIDSDRKIEQETGMSITDIFANYGEADFREKEKEVIAKLARRTNTVIATGGGVVLNSENITRLKSSGIVIALTASAEVILERTGRRSGRPLLDRDDREEIVKKMIAERSELYQQAEYSIDTSDSTLQEVAEKIMNYLRQGGYLRGRG